MYREFQKGKHKNKKWICLKLMLLCVIYLPSKSDAFGKGICSKHRQIMRAEILTVRGGVLTL